MCRFSILLIVALLPVSSVRADVSAESTAIEGVSYPKMGEHRVTYKLLFKLYDAALFAEARRDRRAGVGAQLLISPRVPLFAQHLPRQRF